MKVVALAGGVGGAKLAHGLAQVLAPSDLTVIVNTGDDFEHMGLCISPDIDTVCYTLAGLANPDTGWGRKDESWNMMKNLTRLGGPEWFNLGDQDLATHLERTRRLHSGESLSQVTQSFCNTWGVAARVLPMSDDRISTWVETTGDGDLAFQDYFVRLQCLPEVTGFTFRGARDAAPAPGVIDAIRQSDLIVLCPSNPWVSIGPILAVPGIGEAVLGHEVIAVSPIVGGKAIKGPAAKMYHELGIEPSALAVARQYLPFLTAIVIDLIDQDQAVFIEDLGIEAIVTDTIMKTEQDRAKLAEQVLAYINEASGGSTYL